MGRYRGRRDDDWGDRDDQWESPKRRRQREDAWDDDELSEWFEDVVGWFSPRWGAWLRDQRKQARRKEFLDREKKVNDRRQKEKTRRVREQAYRDGDEFFDEWKS